MKNVSIVVVALAFLVINGCGEALNKDGVKLSEREVYRYNKVQQAVEQLEMECDKVASAPSYDVLIALLNKAKELKYDYNDEDMNLATIQHCDSLKMRIVNCQQRIVSLSEQVIIKSGKINVVNVSEQILTEKTYYPIYLKKGEKLFCEIEASRGLDAKLYNADTEQLIKTYKRNYIYDSLLIANTGVYLLELTPQAKQHVNVVLGFRPTDSSGIYNRPAVVAEQVECKKGDLGAIGIPGIEMRKCFDEPRKFTLRGQLKAAFSGNAKALVSVPVPAGATDILYSMRIATSENSRASDGEFHDNLTRSYKRIKFLGLPIYEKSKSNGLLNTILDDNRPIRDEDAYCNMYVFRNQSQAKQFQDGSKPVSQLNYDVDYSTVGTQSCNGRIPTNGAKTIYLGFENERMRYTNYLWVEVEMVVPNTVYYRTKYSVN